MKRSNRTGIADLHPVTDKPVGENCRTIKEIIEMLGVETGSPDRFIGSLPFSLIEPNDQFIVCSHAGCRIHTAFGLEL